MVRREASLSLVADGSVVIGWYIWGIYVSMVWGELLNPLGSAVGGVECGCLVIVFALFQSHLGEVLVLGWLNRMMITCLRALVVRIGSG